MNQAERKKIAARLDKMCSELVRRRDFDRFKGCCPRCGHPVLTWHKLQWAHLISRNYHKTRWNPDVAIGIDAGCHMFVDGNLEAKKELIDKFIGDKYELLLSAARDTGKVDYRGWELYLKQELEKVQKEVL